MELTTSNRRTEIAELSQADWAVAIREKYGDAKRLMTVWNPQNQYYCAENYRKLNDCPPLVRITKSYGLKVSAALVGNHIAEAIVTMGEEKGADSTDIELIAKAIVTDDRLRRLSLPSLLLFFHKLKGGQFEIYGNISPRKILQEMQKWFPTAMEMQNEVAELAERQKREAELAKARQRGEGEMTAEEYLSQYGVKSFAELITKHQK